MLNSLEHRRLAVNTNVASNAMDGDKKTFMVTTKRIGANATFTLKKKNMKVQSVKITNAPTNASRFTSYRVIVDQTTCGTTPAKVLAGQTVIVTCGTGPNYISGSKIRIETSTDTYL